MEKSNELILTHVTVLFAQLTDTKGFGRNITIDASDKNIQTAIKNWCEQNGLKFKLKEYTNEKTNKTTQQYSFKLSDYTEISGKDGLNESNLGYQAIINLKARPFEYDNQFGKGKSSSLVGIYIVNGSKDTSMDGLVE